METPLQSVSPEACTSAEGSPCEFTHNLFSFFQKSCIIWDEKYVSDKMTFTTTARAKGAEVALDAVLTLDDGSELVLEGDRKVVDEWTTVSYQTSDLAGKTVKAISYRLTSAADSGSLQFRFGNITMIETGTTSNVDLFVSSVRGSVLM